MNRAPLTRDLDFDTQHAAQTGVYQDSDPFGPVLSYQAVSPAYEAHEEPVFATPSIAPSARHPASDDDGAGDADDHALAAPKTPKWLIAAGVFVIAAGLVATGMHYAAQSQAEEQRVAAIEQTQLRVNELKAQHRAEAVAGPVVEQLNTGTSSVAALLAASTNSNGSAGIVVPDAEKPRGRAAARQAAAIKRALATGSVSKHRKVARGRHAKGKRNNAPKDENEAMPEERSDDPIYGL